MNCRFRLSWFWSLDIQNAHSKDWSDLTRWISGPIRFFGRHTCQFVCSVMLRFSHAIFDRNITIGLILLHKGPVIIYQLGGWAILGGGVMKKNLPQMGDQNFIYESIGGHKYDFHFLRWHQNALASGGLCPPPRPLFYQYFFFHLSCPTFHHHHRKMKTWRDMHMLRCPQSDSFVAVHTVTWSYTSTDIL